MSINFTDLDLEYHDIVKRTSDMGFKLILPEAFFGTGLEVYKTNSIDGKIRVPYNRIVRELEKCLLNIDINPDNKYIVMLDELDKKYDLTSEYKDLVLSLLDVAGDINSLTYNPKSLYVIVFLRSDIVNKLKDSDLNKYYDDRIDLDWLVEGVPSQSNLRKLINLRIKTSIVELQNSEDAWQHCFSNEQILERSIFEFMLDRTFHRPRDIIQFCKVCQDVTGTKREIRRDDVLNAEEKYSLWLKKEIIDEVHIEIPQIDYVFDLLRKHGRQTFTLSEFERKKNLYTELRGVDSEAILSKLFDFGIIGNYDNSGYRPRVFFLFRSKHDDVKFNKAEDFIIFRGLNKSLKLFRY
ncbi:hypothetical protein N752_29915 [Desulforamulus aquiferis]|nr:hypothetical protein [Desulforamulus aquiferis]RYD01520.1 hypothetical protein N752_29915 [Desulforamulus aquiferis]